MATRYSDQNFTGDEGELFVAQVCNRSRALFRKWEKDIGIDCAIEFLNEVNEPMGALTLVQVKSGRSFVTASGRYVLTSDKRHFEAWSRYSKHGLSVLGVVYSPDSVDARWVNITQYIESHPGCVESGLYTIEAPEIQVFSMEEFGAFRESALATQANLQRFSAQALIDDYLSLDSSRPLV